MGKNLASDLKYGNAMVPSIGSIGAQTCIEVDGTGYDRALWILNLGVAAADGLIDMKITDFIATGGAGAADITGAVLVQVTKALGDSKMEVIEHRIKPARTFLKAVIVTTTGAFPCGAVCLLYRGSGTFPTALGAAVQRVIV